MVNFHYLQIPLSLQQLLNKCNTVQILFLYYFLCFKIFFFCHLENIYTE